ncbi:hypothetical protein SPRG_14729 [Saprolegnia parasitica CBS 223.65]|uniref:F-box domain-containing protein n=1 Tax=Saprolegnia parasitica (strain CBS 223.65) TaxID=695850 RepID=A0A067C000_SAPPC|nr:hypothetical protein SPRG_14729 [Saprolegnia parasitica CBS 223.65]KDO19886.1 hypothetical protein SPRG_14729 [Saprolegnia parasitica CBS 223.65]|eukprot:XP_012209388.1 hypothetical protein SPRG_14729 [Saprolegnia parasitica CBS 223.65]
MAVVQSNVLVDIIHCLDSTRDVLSLLQALPPASLDAPLAALWTLLVTPDALDAKHWPQVCVEEIDRRYTSIVLAALPLFRSIRIKSIVSLNATLLDAPIEYGTWSRPATADFAAKWGHKIESIEVMPCEEGRGMDEMRRILRRCTGLRRIDCIVDESNATFLNAAVQAVPHVQRIVFLSTCLFRSEHWRPVLSTWLASGHATHLHLDIFTCDDDVEMGHDIAATTSLTSLKLNDSPGVVQGLVDAKVPLPNITELRLQSARSDILRNFVTHRIHHPRLRVLELASNYDASCTFVLLLLPQLSALEELTFHQCKLRDVPALQKTPTPRLRLLHLASCDMDDNVLVRLLDWASRSPSLETVELALCDLPWHEPELGRFVRSLQKCIAVGASSITIHAFSLRCVKTIAEVLRNLHPTTPFVLKIDVMQSECCEPLLEALATCTGVSIEWSFLGGLAHRGFVMMHKLAESLELHIERHAQDMVLIYSPVFPRETTTSTSPPHIF